MLSGCRDAEAAQRTERWEAIWQSAEGHTVGATAASVARFNALVSRACQLGASLRCAPVRVALKLHTAGAQSCPCKMNHLCFSGGPACTACSGTLRRLCRAMLLTDHDRDGHEEAAEPGTSDLASAPGYQTVLDQVRFP